MLRIEVKDKDRKAIGEDLRKVFGDKVLETDTGYQIRHERPASTTHVDVLEEGGRLVVEVDHDYSLIGISRIIVIAYFALIAVAVLLKSRLMVLVVMLSVPATYASIYYIMGKREDRDKALIREAIGGRVLEE